VNLICERVAARIREFRKLRRMSQRQLAESMDTATNTIGRWETQLHTPSVADLAKLAEVLNVPAVNFLLEDTQTFLLEDTLTGKANEMLAAIRGLDDSDIDEVIRYAHFRRATSVLR
jgi:transcriptional regulator with XRE-family HTH domain